MTAWLANHHEWVFILALRWITVSLYKLKKNKHNKRAKGKREVLSQDTSLPIGISTTPGKPVGYGGGSGGGAGSSRSFAPTSPAHRPSAGDSDHIAAMALINNTVAGDTASVEGLSDMVAQTSSLVEAQVDAIPEIGAGVETAVEGVVESVIEAAGELVAGVLKD